METNIIDRPRVGIRVGARIKDKRTGEKFSFVLKSIHHETHEVIAVLERDDHTLIHIPFNSLFENFMLNGKLVNKYAILGYVKGEVLTHWGQILTGEIQ